MSTPEAPRPGMTGTGCAVFALALLVAVPSGLCTAFLGIGAVAGWISDPLNGAGDFAGALVGIVFAGGIFAIAVAAMVAAWRMRKPQ